MGRSQSRLGRATGGSACPVSSETALALQEQLSIARRVAPERGPIGCGQRYAPISAARMVTISGRGRYGRTTRAVAGGRHALVMPLQRGQRATPTSVRPLS